MSKSWRLFFALLLAAVLIAAIPLALLRDTDFAGADGAAEEVQIRPGGQLHQGVPSGGVVLEHGLHTGGEGAVQHRLHRREKAVAIAVQNHPFDRHHPPFLIVHETYVPVKEAGNCEKR